MPSWSTAATSSAGSGSLFDTAWATELVADSEVEASELGSSGAFAGSVFSAVEATVGAAGFGRGGREPRY